MRENRSNKNVMRFMGRENHSNQAHASDSRVKKEQNTATKCVKKASFSLQEISPNQGYEFSNSPIKACFPIPKTVKIPRSLQPAHPTHRIFATNGSSGKTGDPPIHQSTNPPIHQSINPSIHQSTNPLIHQSINPLLCPTTAPQFDKTPRYCWA
jgi:hypothetical protein